MLLHSLPYTSYIVTSFSAVYLQLYGAEVTELI